MHAGFLGLAVLVIFQFDLKPSVADCAFSGFTPTLTAPDVYVIILPSFFAGNDGRNLCPNGKSTQPVAHEG
jgi:hypothetical protein